MAAISKRLDAPWLQRAIPVAGPALAMLALQLVVFPSPARVYMDGIVLGLLSALIAIGLALIYRSNRILSFAQADFGTVPTVLAISIVTFSGWSWWVGLAAGMLAAPLLGAVVEFLLIRRFFKSPRLILTVATIGVAQLLAVCALLLPQLWGENLSSSGLTPPFDWSFSIGEAGRERIYGPGSVLALIVAPVLMLGVALFLRYTSMGIAVRASAERSDRAGMLGIPVQRLQMVVWALAALLSFFGIFLRANILPLPLVVGASLTALLAPLAALMLGRLTNLPAVAVSAVALGVLEQSVVYTTSNEALAYPVIGAVILVALLARRRTETRAEADAVSSWQAADEVRPVPAELRSVPEVLAARWGGLVLVGVFVFFLPGWLGVGDQARAATIAIYAMVTLSVVVLTGWAGQVSLGQMSLVGVGAAVGAVSTVDWGLDLSIGLLIAGSAGAVVAVLIGLPALRLRGLYLAVTTLAFALASSSYLLSRKHFNWIPDERLERMPLFGVFDLTSEKSMYYVSIGCFLLAVVAVRGLRQSRTGRALLAVRENERAAQAYGVNLTRAKLLSFAISGFIAAVAGCLLVHLSGKYDEFAYAPAQSILVFTAAVVGGLGSIVGAVLGSVYLLGGQWFLPSSASGNQTIAVIWNLLPTAVGVLIVLLIFPSGLGGLVYRLRDRWLRSVARRNAIIVPSLVADVASHDAVLGAALDAEAAHDVTPPPVEVGSGPSEDDTPTPVGTGGGAP